MNLCIDVGNTTIGLGVFQEETLRKKLTITVDIKKTSDEYVSVINRMLKENEITAKSNVRCAENAVLIISAHRKDLLTGTH